MIRTVVIGSPIAHSRSPAMHNAAFTAAGIDGTMTALEVPTTADAGTIRRIAKGYDGVSVTVPHKLTALAAADELTAEAVAIGAVNCLFQRGDKLLGTNTDAPGFAAALQEADVRPTRAVILGAGGAARAVAWALADIRCNMTVVARRTGTAEWSKASAPWSAITQLLPDCDLLVDATSAALSDPNAHSDLELVHLPPHAVVASLVYATAASPRLGLLTAAVNRGLRTIDGSAMLVHQAAAAFSLWTQRPAPVEAMRTALAHSNSSVPFDLTL